MAGAAAFAGVARASDRVRRALGVLPDPFVPDAAEGRVLLETVSSRAMGGADISLFTAVPAGHGDGQGLPVVVVMAGASATPADFRGFGFGRFVTATVAAGAPPFVLAGTDDGPAGWVPEVGVDPFTMLREELPDWLAQRGFDAGRRALWGWSRGGYGAIRLAQVTPDWAAACALFSPAVATGDAALADLSALAPLPLGVWCGAEDFFYDDVRALVDRLPKAPEVTSYSSGGHTRAYWNDHTLDALGWLTAHL